MRAIGRAGTALLIAILLPTLATADRFVCDADEGETCLGQIVTQNGTVVDIELEHGQTVNRSEGHTFIELTDNWDRKK